MSVVIRGMDMPKNCTECPFFIKSNSPKYPFVDCKIIGRLGSVFNCVGIPVDCPLIELPPHGRLIDATDLLESDLGGEFYKSVIRPVLMQAQTIIEAEGEQ